MKRNKLFLGGALLVAIGAIAWLAFGGIGKNLVYYWTPSELVAAGARGIGAKVRLGGMVQTGSVKKTPGTNELTFVVLDSKKTVRVHSTSLPPQLFREGIGVVVEGTMTRQGMFESDRLMVKHDNQYRPPKEGHGSEVKDLMKKVVENEGLQP